ncbi:MAG: hypothetical protein KDE25_05245 [Novosphingobium sp.]|nr:hypothetical protein [Novosphingobium sp.]
MGDFENRAGPSSAPLAYFYDFIEQLETEYPYASFASVVDDIAFVQAVGPIIAGLRLSEDGFYQMLTPIGYGHKALIEFEPDFHGIQQPVLGGFIKD